MCDAVVLVRRAISALEQQQKTQRRAAAAAGNAASDFLTGYLRKRSAGISQQRELVHASPLEQRPRSSVYPMQGSILSSRPKSSSEIPGDAFFHPAGASSGPGWAAKGPGLGAHASLSSASTERMAQQYRAQLVRTPENAMRKSAGWYAGDVGGGRQDAHVDMLHQRLEALASRLGNVDERSQRLQELLQQNEANAGDSPSRSQLYPDDTSLYPLTSSSPAPSLGGWAVEGKLASARPGFSGSARAVSAGDPRRQVATSLQGNQNRPVARPGTSGAVFGGAGSARGQASDTGGVLGGSAAGQEERPHEKKATMPKAVMNMLTGIQDTLISLDHIFIKASRTEHEAATRINKIARGYLRRKRYAQGIQALKNFSLRQSKNMAAFFDKYLIKRRDVNAKVRAMNHRGNVKIMRNILSAWTEHVWAIMPIKVNQRQRAYFIAVRTERRFLARVLQEYFKAIRRLRGTYSQKYSI